MAQSAIKTIGWIGTGVMGKSMCLHLLNAGFQLNVYNRTASKADELVSKGAKFLAPEDLAKNSDVVFLMLGYPHDVQQMVLGEQGILKHMKKGSLLIDHTTSAPSLAVEIAAEAQKYGIESIDAPVSGGDIGAREARLAIMCGGSQAAFDLALPILQKYGANIQLLGGAGAGQHTKMTNQILLASNMLGVVEGLLYAHKAGLDLDQVINLIKTGAASSTAWHVLGSRMVKRDFEPGFYVEHFIKDMDIALEEAKRANLCLPGLGLVKQFYHALVAQGGARNGTQAIIKVLEQMNNVQIGKKQ
ncbi:NAD-binding domain of 6-phosphogluconate dehydrogenase family protein (macronuclear) [Tetrahymena thermophila SB210]|uniref:NAD-binding domain of 6-phosphogluconate dehydrogenase family protein n=1 Tax=Tetrahymena thermophila (strain SB210) TaxID=312017 RepID=Q22GZ6_TETTS|nr:NAD-binding domain of 6-phosphogluconate dehydrogenase family protein [Tetrahymena thermophila SB210]EAR84528.1 NAD-binding domain of 6-phosphogluconate dehydrogenase family protein [Tetrahymena thermophila SB210]|eukprot:XP_001032191.1 NAD-binding domain of 6-phosphogluconate dehydrogenase family protein [Tetrahymena thermophila SB210]